MPTSQPQSSTSSVPLLLRLVRYLASLNPARQILWCYLLWYLVVIYRYFDPRPRLWLTSIGLSGIIGIALILSTAGTNQTTKLDRWQIFRLFLMPFCVSSFAALVKDRGFILVFSPEPRDLLTGAGLILIFILLVRLAQRSTSGRPVQLPSAEPVGSTEA